MKEKIGFALYYIVLIAIIGFGLTYIFKNSFMSYHSDIIKMQWVQVDPSFRILVRALMITVGSLAITIAVILAVLLEKYRKSGERWVSNLFLGGGVLYGILLSLGPFYVIFNSDARPPAILSLTVVAVVMLGHILIRKK